MKNVNFDRDLINKFDKIKDKIYIKYHEKNISLMERELLLEYAKNKIFSEKFNFIIESDEEEKIESSKNFLEEKSLKTKIKVNMLKKIVFQKCKILDETFKEIDDEKTDSIYFIFLNRNVEFDSIIKILDYIYKFILDQVNDDNVEKYDNVKDKLIDELNSNCKKIKLDSYSVKYYMNKYKYEFSVSNIEQYEKKYSEVFNKTNLNNILEKNDNYAFIRKVYSDFFHWFIILLEMKNWYYSHMFKLVKITEIYQNHLYNDYNENKTDYKNLNNGDNELIDKIFHTVYQEYEYILDIKFKYS